MGGYRQGFKLLLLCSATSAGAMPPEPLRLSEAWERLLATAEPDLQECRKLAGSTFGDVALVYHVGRKQLTASPAERIGALGSDVAVCAKQAIAQHLPLRYDVDDARGGELTHWLTTGDPVLVLPPPEVLLPVWRRAMAKRSSTAELKKLLPPDYQLTDDLCLLTDRHAIGTAEYLWLSDAGGWISRLWSEDLSARIGVATAYVWSGPGEVVAEREGALCLVQVDSATQAALRVHADEVMGCSVGELDDILVHSQAVFPVAKYTSVATDMYRACATTDDALVCCGRNAPPLSPPRSPLVSIALGHSFACGLDPSGAAVCWGDIEPPPGGKFAKLAANTTQACGLRADGTLTCWQRSRSETALPPTIAAGRYSDVAPPCALREDGAAVCWGGIDAWAPAETFTKLASDGISRICGLRRDESIGCWMTSRRSVETPLPGRFVEIALTSSDVCGRRADGSVRCTKASTLPAGRFLSIRGGLRICGVRDDHSVACWDDLVSFGDGLGGETFGDREGMRQCKQARVPDPLAMVHCLLRDPPPDRHGAVSGRVTDEWDRPIAGAEVVLCREREPCASIASAAQTTPESLHDIAARNPRIDPATLAIATTDSDGWWRAPVTTTGTWGETWLASIVTAPGRELVSSNWRYLPPEGQVPAVVLRPAISIEIEPGCDGAACAGSISISVERHSKHQSTRLDHLPPGSYVVDVRADSRDPSERRAKIPLQVTYESTALRLAAELEPVGTGQSIRGTAELSGKIHGVHVFVRCGLTEDDAVLREATTDEQGTFELRNVGAPPCFVHLLNARDGAVTVEHLPALDLHLTGDEIALPR